jgi:hypothetical protein
MKTGIITNNTATPRANLNTVADKAAPAAAKATSAVAQPAATYEAGAAKPGLLERVENEAKKIGLAVEKELASMVGSHRPARSAGAAATDEPVGEPPEPATIGPANPTSTPYPPPGLPTLVDNEWHRQHQWDVGEKPEKGEDIHTPEEPKFGAE